MMDVTDRHFRWLLRRLTRRTLLYTEMVVARAIHHGDAARLLAFDPDERPLALQLGGDDPALLSEAARIAEDLGYDEVNLNVGCPSERVRDGCFGAVLMKDPGKVATCVSAMREAVQVPVTVKHRLGVDDLDHFDDLCRFVATVSEAGCDRFAVHARKAWLDGLSPKENREIPPLRHELVFELKARFADLRIELNGGIRTLDEAEAVLERVDGVMLGRAVQDDPLVLAGADERFFGVSGPSPTRADVARAMADYLERQAARDPRLRPHHVLRHVAALFTGVPGARRFRRVLAEEMHRGPAAVDRALEAARAP
jgi:tRNA-dihydrouridine synthase A